MTKSLHSFCKENDLAKTSVKRWLNDQGFDTSEGLSDEAIAAATVQFTNIDVFQEASTELLPPDYADPFNGMSPPSEVMTVTYRATDRNLAVSQAEQRIQQICLNSSVNTQQAVQTALENGDHLGMQLGAFLAERTIQSAEKKRQQMLEQYLQAQGVVTEGKKSPQSPLDGDAS